MKKLLLILFLFGSYTTFAQGKIGGEGNVIPTGNYPIVVSKDIKGTLHTFKTIVQRDALPANYKDTGMLAYVVDSLKYYKWNGSDWEEFKTGADAPTDYFTSYTQAPDSSYLQTNRKDGTKQYVVIQADGLTGTGGGSGGITQEQLDDSLNSLSSRSTIQNAYLSSLYTGDNPILNGYMQNVVFDSLNSFGINTYYNGVVSSLNITGGDNTNISSQTDTSSANLGVISGNVANGGAASAIESQNFNSGNLSGIYVYPDLILVSNNPTPGYRNLKIKFKNIDTLSSTPSYIAAFDGDTLKKVAVSTLLIDSTVTLSSGTITVSDTRVKTGARIFVSCNTPSGTQGFLSAKTSDIVDGTSFIINSTSATDNSTVNYEIINP